MKASAWREYLSYYRDKRAGLAVTVLASVAASLLSLPLVLLIRNIFDSVLPTGDIKRLMLYAAAILGCSFAVGALSLWIRQNTLVITKGVILEMRQRVLERVYQLPRAFFGRTDRMAIHNTIVQDTERIDVMSNALVAQVLPALLISITLSVVLLYINWVLLLAMLGVAPLVFWVNRLFRKHLRENSNRFRRSFETFSKGVLFVLQAMDLTRLKAAEPVELERQRRTLEELRAASTRMAWFDTLFRLTQETMTTAASLVILAVGGGAVARGVMTIGELLAFYVTARILNSQAFTVLSSIPGIVLGAEALRDVHALLVKEEREPYLGRRELDFTGEMMLEGVDFWYHPGRPVLRDATLAVTPGATVALVGPNGSGKSTVVSLLCGFYRPQRGKVLADGHLLDELDVRALRRRFGVVPQEPLLFAGSIRENVAYGSPTAADAAIEEAARWATADTVLASLEDGLDTPVGEGGMLLSGGQCQRIAIARALLGQPKLLILDEPTNHLDAAAIRQLMANLKRLPQRPAVVLVSHDERVIEQADVVYRLDGGRVISESRHRLPGAATVEESVG